MSKNDGGSAMTLDLESLRDLLWEIDNQVVTHGIGYREVITRTERVVSEVIAELTARRARDAEVEALVAALREAMGWNWLDEDASPSKVADQCEKALAPFIGDKT